MRIGAGLRCPVVEIAAALLAGMGLAAKAEIVTDGTLGARMSLVGPNFAITSNLGRQVGVNLFHSFSQFTVATGESATFSGPGNIANIIGRVTGGGASQIDGLLRSSVPNANLYLINPKGIAFGPNAALDVSGAFHASSADYLKLADGARFEASTLGMSTFTSATPAAFGFIGAAPAGITASGTTLRGASGKALSLIGGDVRLDSATLSAPSGRVNLASAAAAGEIAVEGAGIAASSVSTFGALTLSNTLIDTSTTAGAAAGSIQIRGGRFVLENSTLYSANGGAVAGSPINVALTDEIVIDGGAVYTTSLGPGAGGAIYLEAPAVTLNNGGFVNTIALGSSASGAITLKVSTLNVAGASNIKTVAMNSGTGGTVTVNAGERIAVAGDGTHIAGVSIGSGNAGDLSIKAPMVDVSDGAAIASDTGGSGSGGRVGIKTGALRLASDGSISAINQGSGSGGTVDIIADSIDISGGKAYPEGRPILTTGLTHYGTYSGLFVTSQEGASGRAGQLRIQADSLRIADGGTISGITLGAGDAGNFDIQARDVNLEGGGLIHTSTSGAGAAGSISLTASESLRASGRLDLVKYAGFAPRSSQSSGIVSKATLDLNPTSPVLGNAGAIAASAPRIWLADGAEISTSAARNASGGTIAITADDLDITRGASISAASLGTGNAGNIAIRSNNALRILEGGSVTTEAGSADGGNIDIVARSLVHLSASKITTSVGTGLGNGGNIFIDPQFVVLNASSIIANAWGGNGGNIRVVAENFLASPDSVVEASSQLGIAGTVQITSPNSDVGAGLAVLPAKFFDAAALLRDSCALRAGSGASSFVAVGRGGLPAAPDGVLLAMPDWGMPAPVTAGTQPQFRDTAGAPPVAGSVDLMRRFTAIQAGTGCGG